MLNIQKPFLWNIQLHIRQDLLQGLWDKYVPSSSPEYEQLQLVYLNGEKGQESSQPRQIQLFIRLLLKNRMLQVGTEQYPSSLAFGIRRMETSLRRVEQYGLTWLKSSNFTVFRSMEHYVTLLEQERQALRRYEEWQKEHQELEKGWEEYRLLALFSRQVRAFLEGHSAPAAGVPEREVLVSLSEAEYHKMAELSVWQNREEVLSYLRNCNEVRCRQIVEHLKEETDFYGSPGQKAGLPETGRKEKSLPREGEPREKESYDRTVRGRFARLNFSGKKYAKLKSGKRRKSEVQEKAEPEELLNGQVPETVPGQSAGEKLAGMAELLEQEEFWWFYQQVAELEYADSPVPVWKKNREEMADYLDRIILRLADKQDEIMPDIPEMKVLQRVREQLDTFYRERLLQTEKEQIQEWNSNFREQISSMAKEEPFTILADVAGSWEEPSQLVLKLEQTRGRRKEQLRRREEQVFEKYREQYQEVLHKTVLTGQASGKDALSEEVFRIRYQERDGWEELTEEEIRNICTWSRLLLETSASVVPDGKQEYDEELVYPASFIRQINQYMESRAIYGENDLLLPEKSRMGKTEREEIRRMLDCVHELKGERKEEFISRLADAVLLRHQTEIFQEVSEKHQAEIKEKQISEITEKQTSEIAEKQGSEITEKQSTESSEVPGFQDTELQFLQSEEAGEAGVPYRELWQWSESLLFHPEQEQEWEDRDILSGQWQKEHFLSGNENQEDLQTQLIRRQIEGAKDRNSLQRFMLQMNHQSEDRLHLVYADSQLAMVPIQNLLRHIRTLDEEQYGILVKELSRITELRRAVDETQKETEVYRSPVLLERKTEEESLTGKKAEEGKSPPEPEKSKIAKPSGAAAYPGLVFYIRGYERQRRLRAQRYFRNLAKVLGIRYAGEVEDNIRYADEMGDDIRFTEESTGSFPFVEEIKEYLFLEDSFSGMSDRKDRRGQIPELLPEYGPVLQDRNFPGDGIQSMAEYEPVLQNRNFLGYGQKTGIQSIPELTYSVEKSHTSEQEQNRAELRMQQETMEIKSAQIQLEQKLKEVEAELRKVETTAQAKEDVSAFAEQVKKRLYEELHVEKLRRGLI